MLVYQRVPHTGKNITQSHKINQNNTQQLALVAPIGTPNDLVVEIPHHTAQIRDVHVLRWIGGLALRTVHVEGVELPCATWNVPKI